MEFTKQSQQLAQQLNNLLTSTNTKVDDTNEVTFAPVVESAKTVLVNNNLSTCEDNVSNLVFTRGWLFG
jgi:hypothetical protein